MRILIVSDIHSNLAAFEAVLADSEREGPLDQVWCLGDLVGYGPDPGACISLLRRYPHLCLAGNHDRAAVGAVRTDDFNPYAARALAWTTTQLTEDQRIYLSGLPEVLVQDEFTLVHGSLRDPLWEYLVTEPAAAAHLELQSTPFSLVGHSHLPLAFSEHGGLPEGRLMGEGSVLALEGRLIANPGSVGQPRDGNPRAAYGLLDTASMRLSYRRVEYDVSLTQEAMARVALPEFLINRLSQGR